MSHVTRCSREWCGRNGALGRGKFSLDSGGQDLDTLGHGGITFERTFHCQMCGHGSERPWLQLKAGHRPASLR